MNRKTHQSEEAFDEFCREIVSAAQASEDDVQAAANAPFLYQRLRAQIAAEPKPIAAIVPQQSSSLSFLAALGAFQNHWRWAFAAAAILAVVILAGLQGRKPAAPQIAGQQVTPANPQEAHNTIAESAPTPSNRSTERGSKPTQIASKIPATKTARTQARRTIAAEANAEVATEFLPLTYSANWEEQRGQIVRMEMPRSVLTTMGVPTTNVTGDRVKADVMLGDDGVALAIRFIQ